MPACPFTHSRVVRAVLALSQVVHLKSWPCATPIQSLASHSWAYFVSPSIANCESVRIKSGWLPGMVLIVCSTARSSPTWFDCLPPGTRMAADSRFNRDRLNNAPRDRAPLRVIGRGHGREPITDTKNAPSVVYLLLQLDTDKLVGTKESSSYNAAALLTISPTISFILANPS